VRSEESVVYVFAPQCAKTQAVIPLLTPHSSLLTPHSSRRVVTNLLRPRAAALMVGYPAFDPLGFGGSPIMPRYPWAQCVRRSRRVGAGGGGLTPRPPADRPKAAIENVHEKASSPARGAVRRPRPGDDNPKVEPGKVEVARHPSPRRVQTSAKSGKPVMLFQMMGKLGRPVSAERTPVSRETVLFSQEKRGEIRQRQLRASVGKVCGPCRSCASTSATARC